MRESSLEYIAELMAIQPCSNIQFAVCERARNVNFTVMLQVIPNLKRVFHRNYRPYMGTMQ